MLSDKPSISLPFVTGNVVEIVLFRGPGLRALRPTWQQTLTSRRQVLEAEYYVILSWVLYLYHDLRYWDLFLTRKSWAIVAFSI